MKIVEADYTFNVTLRDEFLVSDDELNERVREKIDELEYMLYDLIENTLHLTSEIVYDMCIVNDVKDY